MMRALVGARLTVFGRSRQRVLLMIGAAFVFVACGESEVVGGAAVSVPVESAVIGPLMRYPAPATDSYGMAAEVRGELQLEGECLYLFLEEVSERYPVLWPAGTGWDEQAQAVIPPVGTPIPIGSSVHGGGGYLYVDDVERLASADAAALAAACVDNQYGEIAVVNNQDDAIALTSE